MSKPPVQQTLTLAGPAGDLEALLEAPGDREPLAIAVVCHPHPVHGGTMRNKVTHMLARSFVGVGIPALRFNFRGVGASPGKFDNGVGEIEDVLAAIAWTRQSFRDLDLWLAGFSFGAAMAIHAAAASRPVGLVSVAPAVSRFADDLKVQPDCPWLIVQGDKDELVDIEDTLAWINQLDPGPELEIFPDTTHFFHGKLIELRESVQTFVKSSSQML